MPQKYIASLETYSESYETSKSKDFAKIVSGFKSLIVLIKCFILDAWQQFGYTYEAPSLRLIYFM